MKTKLTARPAQIEEAEKISNLVNSAYRGEFSKQGWTTEADLLGGQRIDPDSLKAEIEKRDQAIYLYEDSSNVFLGCVFLKKIHKGDHCLAYLGMLTVDPQKQGLGIGKFILNHAESVSRDWACSQIKMTVIGQRTELLSWYQRQGYLITGLREEFPYGDEKFGIPKRPDLYFEVLMKDL
jgi:ribosomal protein S18 acetylase RimI-like enzyme